MTLSGNLISAWMHCDMTINHEPRDGTGGCPLSDVSANSLALNRNPQEHWPLTLGVVYSAIHWPLTLGVVYSMIHQSLVTGRPPYRTAPRGRFPIHSFKACAGIIPG